MINCVEFWGNQHGGHLVVVRAADHPDGTRPQDVVGKGYYTLEAPDSERARSLLSMYITQDKARFAA